MPRIGELLSHSVPLSDHDLEEILQEQKATRQRFGEAALSLGKASPQQVWDAWVAQMQSGTIDLNRIEPDPAAAAALPSEIAMQHGLIPLRLRGSVLVVSANDLLHESVIRQIERRCGVQLIVARRPRAAGYPAVNPAA